MVTQQVSSLCGEVACQRLCVRSQHCQAGLARRKYLLAAQSVRRFHRHGEIVVHEVNYFKAKGGQS